MRLRELINSAGLMLSKSRRILGILERVDFEEVYNLAPEKCRKDLADAVDRYDYIKVKNWYHDHKVKDLLEMNHKELIRKAQSLNVRNYSRLTRTEIIYEIRRKENDQARNA